MEHLDSLGWSCLGSQAGEDGALPLGDLCVALVMSIAYPPRFPHWAMAGVPALCRALVRFK